MEKPEELFHNEMTTIYKRLRNECGYDAKIFKQMVEEHGGLNAAKILLRGQELSKGFLTLKDLQRLDLSVENLILQPKWRSLFTQAERDAAAEKLKAAGFDFATTTDPSAPQQITTTQVPRCPKCEEPMILRTSKSGNKFYGCVNFPRCRETKSTSNQ